MKVFDAIGELRKGYNEFIELSGVKPMICVIDKEFSLYVTTSTVEKEFCLNVYVSSSCKVRTGQDFIFGIY